MAISPKPISYRDIHPPKYHVASTPIQALANAAECALATLEGMETRKSTSKHEYERAREIAISDLWHLRVFGVTEEDLRAVRASRVADILFPPAQV